jgi:hypothetical protein
MTGSKVHNSSSANDGDFISVTTAAALAGKDERTIRRWCVSGKLEGAEQDAFSGHWRIPHACLNKLAGAHPRLRRRDVLKRLRGLLDDE